MKITSQKNVYYVDIGKSIYKGYIESLITVDKEEILYYKYASMDILSISIHLEDGTTVKPEVQKLLLRDFLKNQDDLNKDENYAKIYNQHEFEKEMSDVLKISGVPEGDVTVRIEYRPAEFNTSVMFYRPVYEDDKHKEVVAINRLGYSYEIFPSLWTDSPRTGYPWELVYILPNSEEYKIVSPGVLKSYNEEEKVNISMYYVEESIPDFINFSVGTFERFEIHNGDDKKVIFLPSNLEEYSDTLNDVVEDLANILKYTEHFLQRSFPIPTLSISFSMIDFELTMGIGTALCNISLLTPSKDIEPMFEIKRTLSSIIASQIFYFYVHYSEITDFWVFCGLKGYLEDYCVRFLLGNNDFLFTLKEDKDFVFENDVYELPLCDRRRDFFSYHTEFFQKKSKLVFHTLESNLSKAFLEKICIFTLKKTNAQIGLNFTPDFILLIKDVTGKDMKSFFDTYVFKSGLISVSFRFTIDKKKNRVDFKVDQKPTSKLPDCNKRLTGLITVKSYEVEGSYDHSFNFNQDNHFYYHTRTKKKKKPEDEEEEIMPLLWIRIDPKREHLVNGVVEQPDYMFIEQLLDKNVIGQIEAIEYLSKRPSVQICEAFERILENSQMFYKVRIRVLYVLAKIDIENFVGFQRVIQFFIKKFCVQASTVIKPNDFTYISYFLQKHSIRALSFIDPFIVKNYNGRNVGSASIVCAFMINILRFNDNSMNSFSDSWYIASVIESLVRPILAMKFPGVGDLINFESKSECKKIFCDKEGPQKANASLEFADSSSNEEDNKNDFNFLVEESSTSSSLASIPERQPEDKTETLNYIDVAVEEIERYRLLDMVFPSHNNIVTESTLYFLGRLAINGCVGIQREVLISLASYPNTFSVRKAALTLLVILFPDKETIEFILGLLKSDIFRIKMAIAEIIEDTVSKNLCDIRNMLGEIKDILFIFPYDPILRDKMQNINLFVEGKDISSEDYNQKLLDFYSSHYDKEFYYKKTMTQSLPFTSDTIKIRLVNFIEMKKEELKNSYTLKLPTGGKDIVQINSHGPSRKKVVKKTEEKAKVEVMKQEVVDIKKEEKMEEKKVKEDEVVEEEKVEEVPGEKGNSIEEVNIKEMLEGDQYTEELLSSCLEKKTVDSPFVISKNNTNSVATTSQNISSTTQALATNVINKTQDFSNKEKVMKIPSNQSKIEENVDDEKVKRMRISEGKVLEGKEVIEKKEHLEGLFREMRDTLNRNFGLLRQERESNTNFNYKAIDAEIVNHKRAEAIDLERLLLDDEEEVQPKTLENILEVDLPKEPLIDIDSFLEGGFDAMPPVNIMRETVENTYRLNSVKTSAFSLRLKIGWSIRIKAVDPRTLTSSSSGESSGSRKKRGRKPRSSSDIMSYESKRVTRAQKIYEETIYGVNIKQFNSLIYKNRETNFFSWIPKTFAEIEDLIFEEIGYSSISKELERALVFLLSYTAPNTRTYTLCKKMFDAFENVRFLYTPIPQEISEMTPVLKDACVDFLNSLFLDDSFSSFIKPVNTDVHKTYIDVVRFPMCLEIIQKKMNVYRSLESFYGDLRQIHKNCCYFNQNSSDICNNARKLVRYVTEFNRQIHGMKVVHKSSEVIKALLSRFSNSSLYEEMIYKIDNRAYKTFSSLLADVEKVKDSYIRVVISPQQVKHDIDDFKAQIYYWFNVIEGKAICFGI